MNQTKIFVTFQKEGIHKYPNAPEEVKFLRNEHRHIFHFRVTIEVFHDDRDIEFILFKRWLESLYSDSSRMSLNYRSCEMIASELCEEVTKKYPNRVIEIEVSEDNENGAILKYTPEG